MQLVKPQLPMYSKENNHQQHLFQLIPKIFSSMSATVVMKICIVRLQ